MILLTNLDYVFDNFFQIGSNVLICLTLSDFVLKKMSSDPEYFRNLLSVDTYTESERSGSCFFGPQYRSDYKINIKV